MTDARAYFRALAEDPAAKASAICWALAALASACATLPLWRHAGVLEIGTAIGVTALTVAAAWHASRIAAARDPSRQATAG